MKKHLLPLTSFPQTPSLSVWKSVSKLICATMFLLSGASINTACANIFEDLKATRSLLEEKGILFEAVYTLDYFANTRGGLIRENTYLSNLDIVFTLNSERVGLWDHGTLFVYVLQNSGAQKLTGSIVGDTQGVSNIEAPRTTRLYELWYEHLFFDDRLSLLTGIQDLNSEFDITEYGSLFLNGSFGIGVEIAGGARPSVFPLAAPVVRVKATPNKSWEFLLGVYDGDPGDPDDSEHFARSDLDREGGAFIISETAYRFSEDVLPGFIKLGAWHNTGEFDDPVDTDSAGEAIKHDGNSGGYLVIDKMVYQEKDEDLEGLGVFLQFGGNQKNVNEVHMYVGGGLNYRGLISGRSNDDLGLGVAHAIINGDVVDAGGRKDYETTLEATYQAQITDYGKIQPNLQYIINPGAVSGVKNALVIGLRLEITL